MGASGYRRTGTNSGLPMGSSNVRTSNNVPNRSSFNSSGSTFGKDSSAQKGTGTTLAHAARNGVIGGSSSINKSTSK